MSMVGFPLLLIPLAIYNIIVFLMPGVSLTEPLVTLPLMSGAQWPLTLSDVLLALGIVMLLFEVIKGARPGAKFLTDHLLSLIVFGGAVAEFLLWPRFASSTYFLLALLSLVDFLSGVSLRVRRGVPATAGATRGVRRSTVEVRREPDLHTSLHPSASAPVNEPASHEPTSHEPARHEPASQEPIIPVPSEPISGHSETTTAMPASEVPPAESQPPKPPEAAH